MTGLSSKLESAYSCFHLPLQTLFESPPFSLMPKRTFRQARTQHHSQTCYDTACVWLQIMYCRCSSKTVVFPPCLKSLSSQQLAVSMQHSHLGCTGCSSGHSPPYMLSSILHFSHNIKKRRKGSEELFIQPRSHPLSLCYISNMQTPLHSTRRESIILKKKRHALLKSKEIPCCR